jgi:hypothetical protein
VLVLGGVLVLAPSTLYSPEFDGGQKKRIAVMFGIFHKMHLRTATCFV